MSHCKLKIGCVIFITIKLPKVGPHSCLVPIRLKAGPLMMANSLGVNASGQDVADFASRKKKKRTTSNDALTKQNQVFYFYRVLRKTGRKVL